MTQTDQSADGTGSPGDDGRSHHVRDGGFRVPWHVDAPDRRFASFVRWQLDRLRRGSPRVPAPGALPLVASDFAVPHADRGEIRITWIGHASFLLQMAGTNLLLDPVWSWRISPVSWAGPRRLVPPGVPLDELPPIDAVILSHDHYDHLDRPTIARLVHRFGDAIRWFAPLGHAAWLRKEGVLTVTELDWHDSARLDAGAGLTLTALPAQHWTQRSARSRNLRLWCSYALRGDDGARVYFGGDSGWFDGYRSIGEEHGPFDVSLMPIGAYAPRWFMRPFHMCPEEAVAAWEALGTQGALVPMHWGTFILSDEPVLEPPARLRREWEAKKLPTELLRIPAHGETVRIHAGEEAGRRP